MRDTGIRTTAKTIKIGIPNVLRSLGRTVGWTGVAITTYSSLTDGYLSLGDVVKMGIGVVTTLTPYGWAYSVLDLGVSIFNNGTSLSDMIGNKVNNW